MAKRKYEKDISLSKTLIVNDIGEVVANCNIKYEENSIFSNFSADEGQNIRLKIPISKSEDNIPEKKANSLSPVTNTKKGIFIVNQTENTSKQARSNNNTEKKHITSECMSKRLIKQEPSLGSDPFSENEHQDGSQLAAECIIIVSANENPLCNSISSKAPTVVPRVIKKESKSLLQAVSEINAKNTILEEFKPGTQQLNIILEQAKVAPDNQSKLCSQEVNIQNIKSENAKEFTTFSTVPVQHQSSQNLKALQTVDGKNVLQIKPKVLLPKASVTDHVTINELSNKQGFKCTRCDNVFFSLAHIQRHMKNCCIDETSASIRYPCPKCSASFHTNGLMIRHQKSCGTQNSSKVKVPCSKCGIHFVKSYIEKHMESCGVKRNSDEVSTCEKCGVRFAGPSLLEKHKERCGQKNKPKTKLTCSSCSTSFVDKISLDKHNEECCEGGKLSALTCFNCGNLFTTKYNLKQHVANCGRESILKKTECFYPSCNKKFFHVKRMLQHIENEHKDMKMDENELTFQSIEDFKKWKEEEESRTMTFYAKEGGKQYKHGTYLYYVCQHSGTDRSHWKYPKVGFKKNKKGTVKIGMMCPARMMVKRLNSGGVSVRYISTHNHEIVFENTQHQPLSEATVRYIKQQLALGVPERKIQENLKVGFIDEDLENSVDDDDLIRKKHLVTLRQIQAIGRRMNVIAQLHKEDAEAIDLLVRKLEISECNPVITYKPQGSPLVIGAVELDDLSFSEDLFALGLQTKEQLDIMRGTDTRVLCIDTTYCKKEGYAFLFTFVLPDGYGKGYPVAHFITNHRDETTLRYLFSSLKEHCPGLSIKAIMTDGSQSGVNAHKALSIIFGETKHLLCHNILNRNWKFRLRALAKGDRTLQHEIVAYLEAMMREQGEDFFQQLGITFIEKYSSVCPRFTEYFSKTYLNKPELWAKCYRVPLDINNDSIPYCQAFNDKLRIYYKNRNLKMRIHELVVLLVSFWNDTQVESVTLDEQEISGAASDSDHYEVEPVVFQLRPQEDQTVHGVFDDLEKLKAYFQNPNIRKEMLLNISGTLNQWVQQCEAVIPSDSIPSDSSTVPSKESDTAVKNLIGTFQF